jgi:hypothetical protein
MSSTVDQDADKGVGKTSPSRRCTWAHVLGAASTILSRKGFAVLLLLNWAPFGAPWWGVVEVRP